MDSFTFYNPTRIHFGTGMISLLGKELSSAGISKVLLVAGGGSIRKNGVYDQVVLSLDKYNIKWAEGWGVRANPELNKAIELIELARSKKVEAILAVGGGSVLDTGKASAAGFYLNELWNAFTRKEAIVRALPLYTVLTLSATGSEMNGNAVITNTSEQKKWAISSPLLYPAVTIIDPSVQCSLPFNQTVNGALDATAHILEYYFADSKSKTTPSINEALLKTIVQVTDILKTNPCDLSSRGDLAWCATLALNGLSGIGMKGGDWACHQIEHAISALRPEIAHGEGLGVIFPAWIEYLSEKDPLSFQRWAKNVWNEETPSQAVKRFRDKICSWGAATSLRGLGLREQDLSDILEIVLYQKTVGSLFPLTAADIEALLMLAY